MKNYTKLLPILLAVLISISAFGTARAQDTNYAFVVFETAVTREGVETSDKNPEERRIYISNVVAFPIRTNADNTTYRNARKIADDYFIANVVEPMKAKGILHQYYDDAIRINNKHIITLETLADAEKVREEAMQGYKEQNANVFTFNWTRDGKANGLETSQPTLLYRGAEQPLYGASEQPKTPPTKPNVKPSTKKKTD